MSKHYFEVSEPYYALIKADSGEEAEKLYNEFVADTDDYEDFQEELKEVTETYAALRFSRERYEDGTLMEISCVMEEFKKNESDVLIYDGSLL
ncbi:hypothetical protein [Bacillus subtilis]|uniref:Uncharacterized protein n=1 Tax=Bacillus subtilis subsp. subtilis TaxID=135461 RepID=A0ABD3ZYY7_BACIU|nr:hypothetical protein [Bacillus subtilis]KIL33437.1 hypothetical protein B4067_4656 [Bacillus subtilis subsp. subtilis]KIN59309.1 hypothetical protein B4145_4551 [Bacillus subtilis]